MKNDRVFRLSVALMKNESDARLIVNLKAQRRILLDILRTILTYPQTVTVEQIRKAILAVGEEP